MRSRLSLDLVGCKRFAVPVIVTRFPLRAAFNNMKQARGYIMSDFATVLLDGEDNASTHSRQGLLGNSHKKTGEVLQRQSHKSGLTSSFHPSCAAWCRISFAHASNRLAHARHAVVFRIYCTVHCDALLTSMQG